jgi:hypothetical protein
VVAFAVFPANTAFHFCARTEVLVKSQRVWLLSADRQQIRPQRSRVTALSRKGQLSVPNRNRSGFSRAVRKVPASPAAGRGRPDLVSGVCSTMEYPNVGQPPFYYRSRDSTLSRYDIFPSLFLSPSPPIQPICLVVLLPRGEYVLLLEWNCPI